MSNRLSIALLTLAMTTLSQLDLQATSYAPAQPETIKSNNGIFTLITNPKTKKHQVYASDDLKTPLWSFNLEMWHFPLYLSNDGKTVCHLAWRHVQEQQLNGTCVTFRNEKGIFKTYKFEEICKNPPKTQDVGVGPIGDFWRTWYNASDCKEDVLYVTTMLNTTYIFSMKDGSMQGGGVTTKS